MGTEGSWSVNSLLAPATHIDLIATGDLDWRYRSYKYDWDDNIIWWEERQSTGFLCSATNQRRLNLFVFLSLSSMAETRTPGMHVARASVVNLLCIFGAGLRGWGQVFFGSMALMHHGVAWIWMKSSGWRFLDFKLKISCLNPKGTFV